MAATIAHQCVLVRGFTDFDVIPDLLALCRENEAGDLVIESRDTRLEWQKLLARNTVRDDHIEPGDFHLGKRQYAVFTHDVLKLASRLRWSSASDAKNLATLGRTPWRERTLEDDWTIQRALRKGIRSYYLGRHGESVVDLLRSGARKLAETKHEPSSLVPGLLLIELWALIYWSFRDPDQARRIHDDLVLHRDAAARREGGFSRSRDPDKGSQKVASPTAQIYNWNTAARRKGGFSHSDDPDKDALFVADATAGRYLDLGGLAANTGLRPTWVRSTAILLTYAGLLTESLLSPVGYFMPPAGDNGDG